jgi:glutamate-5-semialdehyde dehydrogenase
MADFADTARELAARARRASHVIATASTTTKNAVLLRVAHALEGAAQPTVLEANARDVDEAKRAGLSAALVDRLALDDKRLRALAKAVRDVAALPDPVGRVDGLVTQPSGIQVGKMMVPLGVILMVYESRPNVTVDAAALCLKAGNACVLRGGKEARHSNRALADVVQAALAGEGLPADAALFVDEPDRELLYALLEQSKHIDLAIPRGGTSLIDAVNARATMPVIQHYQGICHVYVHESADLDVAERIIVNGKVQRPGVCNATECLVVDAAVADKLLPSVVAKLRAHQVEVRGDERVRAIVSDVKPTTQDDWDTEFLDLVLAVRVVDGYDHAIAFLREHGSRHTESIVAKDHDVAMRFLREVDASCVLVNASTRFNDGGELGLGAELGISTTKLHAYGPMGLEELCARKFIVLGHGETRGSPP